MTKTKLDEAYQRGVKSGQEAGLVDEVFHGMTSIVANTVIGASGLSVIREAEAEEKGYQYGLGHRASPTLKKDDSYVSSSSCSSDYSSSSNYDESSSGNGILWLAFLVASFLGVCIYDNKRIADAKENTAMSRPISKDEVNLRKYDLPSSKTEPMRVSTGDQERRENVSLSKLIDTNNYKKVSSNQITQRNKIVYATNIFHREVNNTLEMRGGQRLMQLSERSKNKDTYVASTNTIYGRTYHSQDMKGGQRLMQLGEKKKSI